MTFSENTIVIVVQILGKPYLKFLLIIKYNLSYTSKRSVSKHSLGLSPILIIIIIHITSFF